MMPSVMRQAIPLKAGAFDEEHIATLPRLYQQAGLQIVGADRLPQTELAGYQTTWPSGLRLDGRARFGALEHGTLEPEVIATQLDSKGESLAGNSRQ